MTDPHSTQPGFRVVPARPNLGPPAATVSTDGSAIPLRRRDGSRFAWRNIGGRGAVVDFGNDRILLSGGEENTDNNRWEILAAIKGIDKVPPNSTGTLITASRLVDEAIRFRIIDCENKDRINNKGRPVANADLLKRLGDVTSTRQIQVEPVPGHAGHLDNQLADRLARRGPSRKRMKSNAICQNSPSDYLLDGGQELRF